MPRIKVKYFASLRELPGNTKEEEYKAKDRTMLMDLLLEHIPERHRNISGSWKEMIFETEKDDSVHLLIYQSSIRRRVRMCCHRISGEVASGSIFGLTSFCNTCASMGGAD